MTLFWIDFASLYNLILPKVSSFDYDSELRTITEYRQSSNIYFSLRSAWKLHPEFKSVNFGGRKTAVIRASGVIY
jgi:hypothetical protein